MAGVGAVGGIPHVVAGGESGLLVQPGDPGALAAACRKVLADGGLADRLGAEGRRQAERRFDWDHLMERYISLFQSLQLRLAAGAATSSSARRR
jgi:glycosyltransferase involved in cell wall biosynthesis